MKLISCFYSRSVLAASVLVTVLSAVDAQGVEPSIASQVVVPVGPAPVRLIANLTPAAERSEVKGRVSFGLVGDVLKVWGRLDGLDPNKLYRLCVALPGKEIPNEKNDRPVGSDGADNSVAPLPADA
jgi:hypothetical protein